MKTGIELIADERHRQVNEEGWTPEHDDAHTDASMAMVAALYAAPVNLYERTKNWEGVEIHTDPWPWKTIVDDMVPIKLNAWDNRRIHDEKRRLVIAGALIAAELDRINRTEERDCE